MQPSGQAVLPALHPKRNLHSQESPGVVSSQTAVVSPSWNMPVNLWSSYVLYRSEYGLLVGITGDSAIGPADWHSRTVLVR